MAIFSRATDRGFRDGAKISIRSDRTLSTSWRVSGRNAIRIILETNAICWSSGIGSIFSLKYWSKKFNLKLKSPCFKNLITSQDLGGPFSADSEFDFYVWPSLGASRAFLSRRKLGISKNAWRSAEKITQIRKRGEKSNDTAAREKYDCVEKHEESRDSTTVQ